MPILAGILLAIPYCLLAGWNAESFVMVALAAPTFLFIWFMTATFAGVVEADHRRTVRFRWRAAFGKGDCRVLPGSLPFFRAWTLYSFLPVIFYLSAVLLRNIGYETVSSLIDTH